MDIFIFVNILVKILLYLITILYKVVPQPKDCGTKGDIMILISADFTAETKD